MTTRNNPKPATPNRPSAGPDEVAAAQSEILRYARRKCLATGVINDHTRAEDIQQAASLTLLRAVTRIEAGTVNRVLYTTVNWRFVEECIRSAKDARHTISISALEDGDGDGDGTREWEHQIVGTADESIEAAETRLDVKDFLDTLNPTQRAVCDDVMSGLLDFQDIAKKYDMHRTELWRLLTSFATAPQLAGPRADIAVARRRAAETARADKRRAAAEAARAEKRRAAA